MKRELVLDAVLYDILNYCVDENINGKCHQLYEKTNDWLMIEYRFGITLRKHTYIQKFMQLNIKNK